MKKKLFWERDKEYYQFPVWMRIVGGIFSACWTAAKIALGAALAALAVVCIAGGVFAVYMGEYLQEDVIPNADYSLESMDLDQTSFIYYIDSEQNIQLQQKIYLHQRFAAGDGNTAFGIISGISLVIPDQRLG